MEEESFSWGYLVVGFCILYSLTWMLPYLVSFLFLQIFMYLFRVIGVSNDNLLAGITIIPWVLHAYLLIDLIFLHWIIPEIY